MAGKSKSLTTVVKLQGYDLTKRIRPTKDQRPKVNPLRAIRSKR